MKNLRMYTLEKKCVCVKYFKFIACRLYISFVLVHIKNCKCFYVKKCKYKCSV